PFVLPGSDMDEANRKRVEEVWNFDIPSWQGDIVGVSLENARLPSNHERHLKLYYMSGGNFLVTRQTMDFVRSCLIEIDVRVQKDINLNTSTLVNVKQAVIIIPAMTRY